MPAAVITSAGQSLLNVLQVGRALDRGDQVRKLRLREGRRERNRSAYTRTKLGGQWPEKPGRQAARVGGELRYVNASS